MEVGNEISQKIRSAIKAKLIELGAYVDDELPDYIMVMVANKKTQKQMTDDLALFLSSNTEKFTHWLHGLLKKLQSINTEQAVGKPKPKEKHKSDKRKSRSSVSDKGSKSEAEPKVSQTEGGKQVAAKGDKSGDKAVKEPTKKETTGNAPAASSSAEITTEINISENTDEFAEECKEIQQKEKVKSASTGKPPPAKVRRQDRSSVDAPAPAKVPSKPRTSSTSDKTKSTASKEVRKKPTSIVASVKRRYVEEDDDEEEYDPQNPAVGSLASVVQGPSRKSSVPKSLQANKSLLMKAVSDAEKSVTTGKRKEPADHHASMHSDQKRPDEGRRLKTAAGLQLISRSKRKQMEEGAMRSTQEADTQPAGKQRKTSGEFKNLKFSVKNEPARISPKSKSASAGQARLAASALKKVVKDSTRTPNGEEEEESGTTNESEGESEDNLDVTEEEEEEEDEEEEDEEEEEDSGSEVEIEVTDRAAQTILNMKQKNFNFSGTSVKVPTVDRSMQTDSEGSKLSKEKLTAVDNSLLHLFIENSLPFTFVENEALKIFAKTLEPKYHFPKKKRLISNIRKLYHVVEEELKSELAGVKSLSFTKCISTNHSKVPYLKVTLHFITEGWQYRTAVLGTSFIDCDNKLGSCCQLLEELKRKWGLPEAVGVVNNTEFERNLFERLGWKRMLCFGGCILSIVKDCLSKKDISEFIQRARKLITNILASELAVQVLNKKKSVLLPEDIQDKDMELDDPRNWSSTVSMLSGLVDLAPAIHAAMMDSDLISDGVDLRSLLYSYSEQAVLESLVKILSTLKTSAEILTKGECPILQKVIPIFIKLYKVLEAGKGENEMMEKLKTDIKSQIDLFLSESRDLCLLACLVHPQTKQLAFVSQSEKDHVRTMLLEEVKVQIEQELGVVDKGFDEACNGAFRRGKKVAQKQTKAMSEMADETECKNEVSQSPEDSRDGNSGNDERSGDSSGNDGVNDVNENSSKTDVANDDTSIGDNINDSSREDEGKDSFLADVNEDSITEEKKKESHEKNVFDVEGSSSEEKCLDDEQDTFVRDVKEVSGDTPKTASKVTGLFVTVENDWLDDVICAGEEKKTPAELAKIELDLYMAEPSSARDGLAWWNEKQLVYPHISQVARNLLMVPASCVPVDMVFWLEKQVEECVTSIDPDYLNIMVFLRENKRFYQ